MIKRAYQKTQSHRTKLRITKFKQSLSNIIWKERATENYVKTFVIEKSIIHKGSSSFCSVSYHIHGDQSITSNKNQGERYGQILILLSKKGGLISFLSGESFIELFSTQSSLFLCTEKSFPVNSALKSLNTTPETKEENPSNFSVNRTQNPPSHRKTAAEKNKCLAHEGKPQKAQSPQGNSKENHFLEAKHNPPPQISDSNPRKFNWSKQKLLFHFLQWQSTQNHATPKSSITKNSFHSSYPKNTLSKKPRIGESWFQKDRKAQQNGCYWLKSVWKTIGFWLYLPSFVL